MEWGMANRLAQLVSSDGRCLFMPIDHGYFQGPTRKLEEPGKTIEPIMPYADAIFVTRGVLRSVIAPGNTKPTLRMKALLPTLTRLSGLMHRRWVSLSLSAPIMRKTRCLIYPGWLMKVKSTVFP